MTNSTPDPADSGRDINAVILQDRLARTVERHEKQINKLSVEIDKAKAAQAEHVKQQEAKDRRALSYGLTLAGSAVLAMAAYIWTSLLQGRLDQ